jgi:PAS domain S-box-containing protein
LYGIDTQGRCTLANRAAAELFGYVPSDLVGQPMHDVLHHSRPDGTPYPHAACPILGAFETGRGVRVDDEVFWHRDGSLVGVEYTAHPIVENGLILGAVVAVRDVRDRKRAEPDGTPYPHAACPFLGAFETGRGVRVDDEVFWHRDASLVRVEYTAHPIVGNGLILGAVVAVRDVRDRKRAEQEIHFQAGLLDAVEQAVVATDLEGTIVYWTRCAETLHGWPVAEVLGRKGQELLLPEELQDRAIEIGARMRNSETWSGELTAKRRDGSAFDFQLTDSHVRNASRQIIGTVGISTDITERKARERALRESNRTLEMLIDASPVAIMLLDHDGTVRSWNPAAEHIYGWTAEEVLGQLAPGVGDDKRAESQAQVETVAPGQALTRSERRRRKKGGEEFDAAIWTVPVSDDDGGGRYFCVVMDITEQKSAEMRRIELAREHAARVEAEISWQRQEFLAEASKRLASSLDYEATLKQVAALAVPRFADYCLVYLLDEHSQPRQRAVAHADPAMIDVLHVLQRYPLASNAPGGVASVVRTGQSAYYADVTEGEYTSRAYDAEHEAMLRALASRSAVIVPLLARGLTLGALTFVRSTSGQRYAPEDVVVAEELARCAGQAIDNARLYQEAQREIAERKRAEVALRESEEHLRSVVASLQEGIVVQLEDGTITACNASAERILGVPAERMIGDKSTDPRWRAIHEDGSFFEDNLQPPIVTLRTGEPQSDVMGIRRPCGELAWISVNSQPMFLDGIRSHPSAVATSFTDITERKQLLEQLEKDRSTLAGIVNNMSDGLLLLGHDRHITYCNQRAGELLSIDHTSVVGKPDVEAFAEVAHLYERAPAILASWEKSLARVDERPCLDLRVAGEPQPDIQMRLFPVPGSPDAGDGIGVVIRDVSAERDLVRAKDEFVAAVSHELASPAMNLAGYAEMLSTQAYPEDERREMLDTMAQEGRRLTTIIRDFLDIQRLQRGQMQVHVRPTDLHNLMNHAASIARRDMSHPLLVDIPKQLPLVQADPERVQQVLANLLSNAQKYTPIGGQIAFSAKLIESRVEIAVADQGLGVPADALPRVFETFYRVEASDRRDIKGTGLGLAIVKDLVEAQGGEVGVSSDGPGKGARFWFRLPLAASNIVATISSSPDLPAVAKSDPQQLRILSVDDDPAVSSALIRLLRPDGHHVAAVCSGEEALERLADERFDVVLADLGLGTGIDGWELARRVRAGWPRVRFVLASGSVGINPVDARDRGVDAILPKPYRALDLRALLVRSTALSDGEAA